MNYAAIRAKTNEKIQANKAKLSKMSGADRSKLEAHLIAEATKEVSGEAQLPLEPAQDQPLDGVKVVEKKSKPGQKQGA